jgi:hypothetical protein
LAANLLTPVVTLRPRLPHGTGGKHGRRRGFVGGRRSRDRGVAVAKVIAAGVVCCVRARGCMGGRAAALCSDI